MPGTVRNIRGLTLLEVLVTMAVVSAMMGGIVMFMDRVIHFKGTADTMQRFKRIEIALEVMYEENIRYVEGNCYGWTDSGCSTLTVLPVVDASGSTHLTVATMTQAVVNSFREAGCTTTSTVSPYTFTCPDGYGSSFTFAADNEHSAGSLYLNGYSRTPYSITIQSGGNTSISDTWTSGYLDSQRMVRSQEKILAIARAMKSYHLSRLTTESVLNPCSSSSGGLASNDDIFVPWIWQALGSYQNQVCSGIESGSCGCSSFGTSVWPTDASLNIVNASGTITSFLASISAGSIYRVDGFGNPVTIILLATSAGASVGSAPGRPSPSYSWSVTPPYTGIIEVANASGTPVYSERVVYVQ